MGLGHIYPLLHRVPELDWVRYYRQDNKLTRWPQGYESQFFWLDDCQNCAAVGQQLAGLTPLIGHQRNAL